jgi:hypothetical protein
LGLRLFELENAALNDGLLAGLEVFADAFTK